MADKLSVRTTAGFWYLQAVLILLLPMQWYLAILISSAVHELFHLLAAYGVGVSVHCLVLTPFGIYLETESMGCRQQLVVSLAGPLGALLLLFLVSFAPRTALCGLLQSFYHLLPVYPLDGGRALRSWTGYIGIPWGKSLCCVVEILTMITLLGIGFVLSFVFELGFLPEILCGGVVFRLLQEKFLANRRGTQYNICTK